MRLLCPFRILIVLTLTSIACVTGLADRAESRRAKTAEGAYLETNRAKEGIATTRSGLQYEILSKGDSDHHPSGRNTIELHYHGTFVDGTVFDSSLLRGEPIEIKLWDVIPGWTEGLKLMSPGDKYRFTIPSKLAYGSEDVGAIPAYSTLIFEIELIALETRSKKKK